MLQGERNPRPRLSRRATAHGIDDDHHGSLRAHRFVDLLRRAELLKPETRQLRAHRCDEWLWIWHAAIVLRSERGDVSGNGGGLVNRRYCSGGERVQERINVTTVEPALRDFLQQVADRVLGLQSATIGTLRGQRVVDVDDADNLREQ